MADTAAEELLSEAQDELDPQVKYLQELVSGVVGALPSEAYAPSLDPNQNVLGCLPECWLLA